MDSIFDQFRDQAWPHKFEVQLSINAISGGIPTDPKVAEGWIRTKLGSTDDLLREQVAQTMAERGVTAEEAAKLVGDARHLNGFKRDAAHGLYIEGRQVKSMLKEAASIAVAAGKLTLRGWGLTNKNLLSFLAEHVVVDDDKIYLGVHEPSDIVQRFVHTWRGTGIQYEEVVHDVKINFTVLSDWNFSDEEWAMIFLTGEQQGLGAARSQGMGRFRVTGWTRIPTGHEGAKVTGSSKPPASPRRTKKS